eukprot:PhM_4_TR16786/c0_g1_i1/m.103515
MSAKFLCKKALFIRSLILYIREEGGSLICVGSTKCTAARRRSVSSSLRYVAAKSCAFFSFRIRSAALRPPGRPPAALLFSLRILSSCRNSFSCSLRDLTSRTMSRYLLFGTVLVRSCSFSELSRVTTVLRFSTTSLRSCTCRSRRDEAGGLWPDDSCCSIATIRSCTCRSRRRALIASISRSTRRSSTVPSRPSTFSSNSRRSSRALMGSTHEGGGAGAPTVSRILNSLISFSRRRTSSLATLTRRCRAAASISLSALIVRCSFSFSASRAMISCFAALTSITEAYSTRCCCAETSLILSSMFSFFRASTWSTSFLVSADFVVAPASSDLSRSISFFIRFVASHCCTSRPRWDMDAAPEDFAMLKGPSASVV